MIGMRVRPDGFDRLRRLLDVRLTDGDKAGPLLREMDRTHNRQARAAFTTEGASTGQPWRPLWPPYARWKRKVRPGRKMLVFDGETKAAYTMPTNPGHIRRFIRPFTYAFGVVSEKAWRHEHGVGVGRQRLPRRSVLQKTAADLREFVQTLRTFYIKRLRQVARSK